MTGLFTNKTASAHNLSRRVENWRQVWTPAQTSEACERWGSGQTYDEIAAAVGMSRGSVAGRFARLRGQALGRAGVRLMCDWLWDGFGFRAIAGRLRVPVEDVEFSFANVRRSMGSQAV